MSLLVVGALHWDTIVHAPRLPREDETLMGSAVRHVFGGKGGNQAVAAARAGARVAFAGRVGDDEPGRAMARILQDAGVDVAGLQRGAGASGMSVAIVARDGAYQAVVVSGENRAIDADAIRLPPDCRAVLMQNEVDPRLFAAMGVRARSAGARLMVNAAPAVGLDPALLAPADDVIVNRVEACDLLGSAAGSDPRALVAALQGRLPGARIVVTLGAEGVAFAEPGAAPAHAPARRVPVVSTHGAGDMFVGAMAAATLRGAPLAKAVAAGQTAAAAHVSADPSSR